MSRGPERHPLDELFAQSAARLPDLDWIPPAEIRQRATRRLRRQRVAAGSTASVVVAVGLVVSLAISSAIVAPMLATSGSRSTTVASAVTSSHVSVRSRDPDVAAAQRAQRGFALALTSALFESNPSGNVIVSPASLDTVLTMLELGTRGETRTEIGNALGQGEASAAAQARGWDYLKARLAADARGGSFYLRSAEFLQSGLPIERSYLASLDAYFASGVHRVDFATPGARRAVNQWASQNSHGVVGALLPPGATTSRTAIVLASVFGIDLPWASGLEVGAVGKLRFGTLGDVPGIEIRSDAVPYVHGRGLDAVVLALAGAKFQAVAVMPTGGKSLASLVRGMSAASLRSLLESAATGPVDVQLPVVSIASNADLRGPLTSMGMGPAFGMGADFSGIAPGLHLQAVQQAATLGIGVNGVSEHAGDAGVAGLNAGGVGASGELRFDEPFVFLVMDTATQAIVSDAIVEDPTS